MPSPERVLSKLRIAEIAHSLGLHTTDVHSKHETIKQYQKYSYEMAYTFDETSNTPANVTTLLADRMRDTLASHRIIDSEYGNPYRMNLKVVIKKDAAHGIVRMWIRGTGTRIPKHKM